MTKRTSNLSAVALSFAVMTALSLAAPAAAQDKKKQGTVEIAKSLSEISLSRDLFTGTDARIAAMNNVNADCTSGLVPAVRIVTPPKNGEIRMEEISYPLERPKNDPRAGCIGKPVTALGIFYKSRADYVGADTLVLDVDFKTGYVRRFNFRTTVR